MFRLSCFTLLVLIGMAASAPTKDKKPQYELADAPALFEKFIKDYNRNYKDEEDRRVHYEEFVKTIKTVNELNSDPNGTGTFDINLFADYTDEERKKMRGILLL